MQKSEPAIKQFFVKKKENQILYSGKIHSSKQISNEITRLSKKMFLIIFITHFLIKFYL